MLWLPTSIPPKLRSLAPPHQLSERWPSLWVQTMSVWPVQGPRRPGQGCPICQRPSVSGEEGYHLSHRSLSPGYRLDISPQAEGPKWEAVPPLGSCTPDMCLNVAGVYEAHVLTVLPTPPLRAQEAPALPMPVSGCVASAPSVLCPPAPPGSPPRRLQQRGDPLASSIEDPAGKGRGHHLGAQS